MIRRRLRQSARHDRAIGIAGILAIAVGFLVAVVGHGTAAAATSCPTSDPVSASVTTAVAPVGGTVRLEGTNWCHPTDGGSTIAVKIDEGAYSHLTGEGVHANLTIWQIVAVDATGSFAVDIQLPTATNSTPAFGDGAHTLRLLTGSLKTNDTGRSFLTNEFTIGAAPTPSETSTSPTPTPSETTTSPTPTPSETTTSPSPTPSETSTSPAASCPTGGAATASVTTASAPVGGIVRLVGANWCHPSDGGSTIGVKIDDGAYSHLAGQGVHANLTIWQIVTVDATGSFAVDVQLPTATNATPVFGDGAHTLRLLSGSLKSGDTIRTVQTNEFTVTSGSGGGGSSAPARPATIPDPMEETEDLTDATRGGVTAAVDGTTLTLTVPGAAPGDWVFVYTFSSPVPVDWFALDASQSLQVDLAKLALDPGLHKVSVQARTGALIGWSDFLAPAAAATAPLAAGTGASLAQTGGESSAWLAWGVLCMVAGVLLLIVSRPLRQARVRQGRVRQAHARGGRA